MRKPLGSYGLRHEANVKKCDPIENNFNNDEIRNTGMCKIIFLCLLKIRKVGPVALLSSQCL